MATPTPADSTSISPTAPVPTKRHEPPMALTICEHCGQPSIKLSFYELDTLAVTWGVTHQTIRNWITRGYLRARVWPVQRGVLRRVVSAEDAVKFLDFRAPWPEDLDPNSPSPFVRLAHRLFYRQLNIARRGGLATQAKRRAANLAASHIDPAT